MNVEKFQSLILYEDNHLLIINKENGIPVQNEGENKKSFYHFAKSYLKYTGNKKGEAWVGIVHRLDKNVSGVLIFAKNSKSASRLSKEIADRNMKKKYIAVVEGNFIEKRGELRNYLRKFDRKSEIVSGNFKGAKKVILSYNVISSHKEISFLEINLITGFYHQIRCQLSNINHPLLGDIKYSSKINLVKNRIFLHCASIEIKHPVSKETLIIRANIPDFWGSLQKKNSLLLSDIMSYINE